jgi:O-antigen ligase
MTTETKALLRVWLLFAILLLLPFGSLSELPLLVAAAIGIGDAWRRRSELFADVQGKLIAVLFAGYWFPELVSAFDSVAPEKSWLEVAADLRFLPFAWFVCIAVQDRRARDWLGSASAVLILLWAVDALLQASLGVGLGGRMQGDRVSGIFSDDNLKLGPVLATLTPIALWWLWTRWRWVGLIVGWALLAAAVLLAGARAAWLSFAIVTLALLWKTAGSPRRFIQIGAGALLLGGAVFAASYAFSDLLQARVDRSLQVLRGTEASWDTALAHRLPIWTTSVRMASAHPINGVGVRAFRYAYADYASVDDIWLTTPNGYALHAHQIVLEIWTETGSIGLLCWLAALIVLLRRWHQASLESRALALPWGLALVSMCFPLNTHLAFYSSFWGLLFWWLLALFAAHLTPSRSVRSTYGQVAE